MVQEGRIASKQNITHQIDEWNIVQNLKMSTMFQIFKLNHCLWYRNIQALCDHCYCYIFVYLFILSFDSLQYNSNSIILFRYITTMSTFFFQNIKINTTIMLRTLIYLYITALYNSYLAVEFTINHYEVFIDWGLINSMFLPICS